MNINKILSNPFKTAENLCSVCEVRYEFEEISRNWKCLVCGESLIVRVVMADRLDWCCTFIHPDSLKTGDFVTLDSSNRYKVIRVSNMEDHYRIALKDYKEIRRLPNDWIALVNGLW